MKTINADQFQQIQLHLMSGVNLLQQARMVFGVSAVDGLKLMDQAEAEIMRALQMYAALPEDSDPAA